MALEGKVIISLKNISRDELNVDADELMERFVRGDDSRNTEVMERFLTEEELEQEK